MKKKGGGDHDKRSETYPSHPTKSVPFFSFLSFIQEGWLMKKMSWQDCKRMCKCSGVCCVSLSLLPTLVLGLSLLETKSRCSSTPDKGLLQKSKEAWEQLVVATVLLEPGQQTLVAKALLEAILQSLFFPVAPLPHSSLFTAHLLERIFYQR